MMRDNESARDKENIMREREISYFSTSDTILCIKINSVSFSVCSGVLTLSVVEFFFKIPFF